MKKIVYYILKILSKAILKKYKPDVIGITGSVGKTTTKKAVETILDNEFNVRASQKSFNTEIGVPLTIIGKDNPGKNLLGWLSVILSSLFLIVIKNKKYPRILILEMAADHPGDIKYLVDYTKPRVGVITSVGPTHLEFFGSVEAVAKEKATMITSLRSDAYAIVNNDQKVLQEIATKTKAQVLTYSLKKGDLVASDILLNSKDGGLSFKVKYRFDEAVITLSAVLGKPIVYSLLAAIAVALTYGLDLKKIAKNLENFEPLPGRLHLMPGIKYTKLIDDSYNSSPLAASAALEILSELSCTGNKFAVLGDMLELGDHTKKAHQELGTLVAKHNINYLITVGSRSEDAMRSAKDYGMNPDRIFHFDTSENAGRFLQDRIEEGDLILIKGSAAVNMERIVKEIMAEPERANELLVRQ